MDTGPAHRTSHAQQQRWRPGSSVIRRLRSSQKTLSERWTVSKPMEVKNLAKIVLNGNVRYCSVTNVAGMDTARPLVCGPGPEHRNCEICGQNGHSATVCKKLPGKLTPPKLDSASSLNRFQFPSLPWGLSQLSYNCCTQIFYESSGCQFDVLSCMQVQVLNCAVIIAVSLNLRFNQEGGVMLIFF